jgi:hypothetical protein
VRGDLSAKDVQLFDEPSLCFSLILHGTSCWLGRILRGDRLTRPYGVSGSGSRRETPSHEQTSGAGRKAAFMYQD